MPEPATPYVRRLGERCYAYIQPDGTWYLNNTGFVVGNHAVVSIDSCATETRTRAYQASISEVTDAPVRTVVNTHHHGDHTFGNWLFRDATIISHHETPAAMRAWGPPRDAPYWTAVDWGRFEMTQPSLTYADGVTLWVDDLRCEVRHVGRTAHTSNDSIVWIPEHRILFAGDLLFNGGTPFVVQGSLAGAVAVLTEVLAPLDPAIVVPGHGPVGGPDLIEDNLAYLLFVQGLAREAYGAGLAPLEAARSASLGPHAERTDPERLVANLHRAYAEITDFEVDVAAALNDMITYNGGPLRTHA